MALFDPASYGDSSAAFYDQLYPNVPAGLIQTLVGLADGGPALELGLATGRVALPLAAAGVSVHGIEASPAMLVRFRSRPGADSLRVVCGDFSRLPYCGHFRLVFSLVGTLGLLPSLALQEQCFRDVHRLLGPNGAFLCEAFDVTAATQPSTYEHSILTPTGLRAYRVTFLATPPSVLDQLAASAGLSLSARWSGWSQAPYTSARPHHISVYRKAAV